MFPQYSSLLQSAGFVDVQAHEEPTPLGPWPKDRRLREIGIFNVHQFLEAAVDSYSLALFTRLGGWTEAETQVLLSHVREEIKSNKMHVYTTWYVDCLPRSCGHSMTSRSFHDTNAEKLLCHCAKTSSAVTTHSCYD